ncbi:MAG: TIGR01244 family sulfur transferase [Polaromonas sp.]|uniref:TIGR01244 family sulfur transferase n=1 Tax=Polaromonas sp. TaxID=1869339 RepID=UPI004035EDAC
MAPLKLVPLSETVSVAGQISPSDLPGIAGAGFKSVICNRPDGESPGQFNHRELALAASQAGLTLAYLPVVPGRVSQQDGQAFASLLDQLPAPTLAYCRSGMRSATLWALSQADRQPWPTLVQKAAQAGFNLSGVAPPAQTSHP